MLVYVIVAFALLGRLSFLGLVWADSAKQASHALVMIALLGGRIKLLSAGAIRSFLRIGIGALLMAGVISLIRKLMSTWLPSGPVDDLLLLLLAGGAGVFTYGMLLYLTGEDEVQRFGEWIRNRIGIQSR